MRIKEKIKIEQEVTKYIECDVCEKRVKGKEPPEDWFHFSHSHQGWGNDSIDSLKYFDVCSVTCFTVQLRESIESVKNNTGGEVAEMPVPFAEKLLKALK